jgi:hypothetical protein
MCLRKQAVYLQLKKPLAGKSKPERNKAIYERLYSVVNF